MILYIIISVKSESLLVFLYYQYKILIFKGYDDTIALL